MEDLHLLKAVEMSYLVPEHQRLERIEWPLKN